MSEYRFFSMSDMVAWRYPWWWKYRHPWIYHRMRNAYKGSPSLSDLLEGDD